MDPINTGGPAFPVHELNGQGEQELTCIGMTLRDYFAAQFMVRAQSLCESNSGWHEGTVAQCAYSMADAMIAARGA